MMSQENYAEEAASKESIQRKKEKKPHRFIALRIVIWVLFALSLLILYALKWSNNEYGQVPFAQIVFHLKVPMTGTSKSLVWDFIKGYIKSCAITTLLGFALLFVLPYIVRKIRELGNKKPLKVLRGIYLSVSMVLSVGFLGYILFFSWNYLEIGDYIYDMNHPTTIYEDYYVDSSTADITFPTEKKNLIYIFLESMEDSYTTAENGGKMRENLIPNLTEIALENENFSSEDTTILNGGIAATNATWTVAAMVAQTSGIPLSIPVNGNSYGHYAAFLPGVTSIGDLLSDQGYNLEIMMGSKASFGGRENYFTQHGDYMIYDYNYAVENGNIPSDYYEFWGYEDAKLFSYAKEELTRLSEEDEPFDFTMLTVDTHFPQGYICDQCEDYFGTDMENAIACSDRLVSAFVEWIQEQDFYEDTIIVIAGDHPNMGNTIKNLINDENYQRLTYFTIINSDTERETDDTRTFTTMDIFPTTLSAMGCAIEGDRLGLGTDLYSDTPTLVEQLGLSTLNEELAKKSDFYDKQILGE